jgi:ABC-type Fe3+-hydroxamate transport system substrate-binding protein
MKVKHLAIAVAVLVALAVVYLAPDPKAHGPRKGPPYARIVSILPSVTELIYAVGAEDRLVGVTTYCDYPPEATKKEKIGDIRVNYEKVLALRPDVVMSAERMTRDTNRAIEALGIPVLDMYGESFEEIAEVMRRLGRVTDHAARGEAEAEALLKRVRAVEERVKGKPRPRVFFESSYDPLWSVSGKSYVGDVIARAGGDNVMADMRDPWGPVSWEVVVRKDPDVILIAHGASAGAELRAGWSNLKAVRTGRVHVVAKEEFIYPTGRLVLGLERAAKLFHDTR